MPHNSFKLIPGVDQNKTPALNEAALSTTNLIRFVPDRSGLGLVQKLGGWTAYGNTPSTPYPSPATITRALWAWEDTNAVTYLAAGNQADTALLQASLNVMSNGSFYTITPRTLTTNPAANASTNFSTTINSAVVTITDTNIAATIYSSVFISTPVSIGGIVLSGFYQIISGTGVAGNPYTILSIDLLGNPLAATSNSTTAVTPSFAATSGQSTISVTLPNHGYSAGSTFAVLIPWSAGFGVTLFGNYIVQSVTSSSVFVIQAPQNATSTGSGYLNNGNANLVYYIGTGAIPAGTGYGILGYGSGAYGYGSTVTPTAGIPIYCNDWTLDNWGQILISCPVPALAVNLTTTGASGSAGTATLTYGGSYIIPIGNVITVTNVAPAGYNGIAYVTGLTATFTNGSTAITGSGFPTLVGTPLTFTTTGALPTNFSPGTIYYIKTSTGTSMTVATSVGGTAVSAGSAGSGTQKVAFGGRVSYANATTAAYTAAGQIVTVDPASGPIFAWDPTSGSSYATVIPQAPPVNDGIFVAMPQRQIVAWGSTFTGIPDPLLIRWCDVQNYGEWIAQSTNQAGSYRLPRGSRIVGCIQGPQQGLIWTDLAVWSMQYTGQPYIYSFNEISTGCGLIGRKAAGSFNGTVYWMGQSQFFSLSAGGVTPVPCPIWDVIFQALDTTNLDKIRVAVNSRFGEVTWYYPTTTSGGEVSNYAKYNTLIGQWDFGVLGRSAWINESVLGPPIGADPSSLVIYQHETSTDAGSSPMLSSFQTGYFALNEADLKMFIDEVWPDMKWGYYGGTQSATVSLTFYATDYPGTTPVTYGPFTLNQSTTFVSPRMRGRLVSIALSSSDSGTFWRIGNMRYRSQPDGRY